MKLESTVTSWKQMLYVSYHEYSNIKLVLMYQKPVTMWIELKHVIDYIIVAFGILAIGTIVIGIFIWNFDEIKMLYYKGKK